MTSLSKTGYASYLVSEMRIFLGVVYLVVALLFRKSQTSEATVAFDQSQEPFKI